MGFQAIIKFWGADHSLNQAPPPASRWTTRIKLEITSHELIFFEPLYLGIEHVYTDVLIRQENILCYDLREVMAEKIRSLIQRSYSAPRDYYDIYQLRDQFDQDDWIEINHAFIEKLEFKGLTYQGVHQLINEEILEQIRLSWSRSLSHQLKASELPVLHEVIDVLKALFSDKLK